MQILAGRYKGIRIKTKSKAPYRPTSSRVRKSLFDTLGPLDGLKVLDLFAGTGILGFEAASRGAAQTTFVEKHHNTVKELKENLNLFQNFPGLVIKADAYSFLRKKTGYDLIFADPPYVSARYNQLIELGLENLTKGGRFVLESSPQNFPISPGKSKIYGDTQISIWTKT